MHLKTRSTEGIVCSKQGNKTRHAFGQTARFYRYDDISLAAQSSTNHTNKYVTIQKPKLVFQLPVAVQSKGRAIHSKEGPWNRDKCSEKAVKKQVRPPLSTLLSLS